MARARRKSNGRQNRQSRRTRQARQGRSAARSARQDAIAILKADHRQVEGWFKQFEGTESKQRKGTLAGKICEALKVHTTIEEELFYPAFLQATEDKEIHHEAEVEHNGAKKLIAEIEDSNPDDEYYDAKVTVLREMIKHHVKEEEKPGGMFAEARRSDMDLEALGEQLRARKQELANGENRWERVAELIQPRV